MTPISSTNELPYTNCLYEMYMVADEAEAAKVADGREAYLFNSKIVKALYLFVPQIPFTDPLPAVMELGELDWIKTS